MPNRVFNLRTDATSPSVTVDVAPPFKDMELSFAEIEVFRGDDVSINFTVTQNGQAFSLAGYTVLYQGKTAFGDTSFVFSKTATVTDAAGGRCRVDLTGSDLDEAGTLQTQLYLSSNGTTQTIMQFPLVVQPSV